MKAAAQTFCKCNFMKTLLHCATPLAVAHAPAAIETRDAILKLRSAVESLACTERDTELHEGAALRGPLHVPYASPAVHSSSARLIVRSAPHFPDS